MSVPQRGMCPECDFEFTTPALETGETIVCPECALTVQVVATVGTRLKLEVVETTLPDWGQ